MSLNQILQPKIGMRQRFIATLDPIVASLHASLRQLNEQQLAHEIAMKERVEKGTDHVRWTVWADQRLAGMQMQAKGLMQRIDQHLTEIAGHEAAIKSYQFELDGSQRFRSIPVGVSRARVSVSPGGFEGKTLLDLDRKPPSKKPLRRYVPKGGRNTSAESKPAKKDKKPKNAKPGRQAA